MEREEEVARLERHVWVRMWTPVYLQILNFTLGATGRCKFLSDTMNVAKSTEHCKLAGLTGALGSVI